MRKSDGAPPLFVAAQHGHLDVVKYLVEHGAAIDSPRNTGATPLFITCQHGHLDVAKYLVKRGAQVSAPTKKVRICTLPCFKLTVLPYRELLLCL